MASQTHSVAQSDAEFDRQMRAVLNSTLPVSDVPVSLLRTERWCSPASAGLLCAGLLVGALAGAAFLLRPPDLVREAIAHERNERTLRGNFMPAHASLAAHFGLPAASPLPGFLQMAKPCRITGRVAFHVTTWLDGVEGGGMVTAITYAQPVSLPERSGWWPDTYWRVVRTAAGVNVMLFAQNKKAIEAAVPRFR